MFFPNSLWILSLFGEFTMESLSILRTYFEFTISFANSLGIHYFFANSLWIYCLFREFTMALLIYRIFTLDLIFLSRIHSQSIIFFANEFTIFSWTHYESINFFAYSLWIHYLFRVYTMDPLSSSPIRYTICIANYTIFTLYDEIITW